MSEVEKAFFSPKEAAVFLNMSARTIYRYVQAREIPYRKHGKLVRFYIQDLLRWSKAREVKPYYEDFKVIKRTK